MRASDAKLKMSMTELLDCRPKKSKKKKKEQKTEKCSYVCKSKQAELNTQNKQDIMKSWLYKKRQPDGGGSS